MLGERRTARSALCKTGSAALDLVHSYYGSPAATIMQRVYRHRLDKIIMRTLYTCSCSTRRAGLWDAHTQPLHSHLILRCAAALQVITGKE